MERAERKENLDSDSNGKTLSSGKDDSLTDFKSPKRDQTVPTKVKIIGNTRAKKATSNKGKSSTNKKKDAARREVAQPSIESSFFNAAINDKRDGHTCPLCMKYFGDKSLASAHTKSCAAKNNVSTKKLLAAVALQQRQADERVAIGLPAGPLLQQKPKAPRRARETVSKEDPDLQLALALSKSLQENQLEQEFEEALLLAGEHRGDGKFAVFANDNERRKTLKNFGFSTNKPVEDTEVPTRTRRKKHLGPTILQTRTKDARDRILTERIAQVLMGNEAITQVCHEEIINEINLIENQRVVLRSRFLRTIYENTKRLWEYAKLPGRATSFYVEELGPVIAPAITPIQEKPEEPVAVDDKNLKQVVEEDTNESIPAVLENCSIVETGEAIEKMSTNDDESPSPIPNDIRITDRQYRNTLSMDWANTLNVSSISDVVVLVKNNHIWAHKLVFHVRCSNILLDCETNTDEKFSHVKEKIIWTDVDFATGLAFLEYVYTGLIEKNVKVFDDEDGVRGVRRLARKYRLKSLFDYLRSNKIEITKISNNTDLSVSQKSELRSSIAIETDEGFGKSENRNKQHLTNLESTDTENNVELLENSLNRTPEVISIAETNCLVEKNFDSQSKCSTEVASVISLGSSCSSSRKSGAVSPDLFDETTEEAPTTIVPSNDEIIPKNNDSTSNENSNLKILVDLMNEDNFSMTTETIEQSAFMPNVENIVTEESRIIADETNEFSSLSVTPKSRGISNVSQTDKIVETHRSQLLSKKKTKSNLSLFIEKVQRINAKGALDSYSEEESLVVSNVPNKRKNPFKVNDVDDMNESSFVDSDRRRMINDRRLRRDKKRGLSVFDEPSKSKNASLQDDDFNRVDGKSTTEKSFVIDDTVDDDGEKNVEDDEDDEEEDTSMYSKYRKTHRQNNSIANYRNILMKLDNTTGTPETNERSDNFSCSASEKQPAPIDLTQESDNEVDFPSSPMSIKNFHNLADNFGSNESIHSASTAVVHSPNSNTSDDEHDCEIDANNPKINAHLNNSSIESLLNKTKNTKQDEKNYSVHELSINSTPESVKSGKFEESMRRVDSDDEITVQNRKSQSPNISSKSIGNLSRERDSENIVKKKNPERVKNVEKNETSTNVVGNSEKSSEYPELDVFEIDENMLTQSSRNNWISPRKSITPSPRRSFDYFDKSVGSRRRRRAEEKSTKKNARSFDKNVPTENPINVSTNFSDVDVDYLFTQSLLNDENLIDRSFTPEGDRQSDENENIASSLRQRTKNNERDAMSDGSVHDLEINHSKKTSDEKNSNNLEADENYVFTQSFDFSRLSPDRALSLSPDRPAIDKNIHEGSNLKAPSPIVITSSPEFVADTENNSFRNEEYSRRSNSFANSLRTSSSTNQRKSIGKSAETIFPKNHEDVENLSEFIGTSKIRKSPIIAATEACTSGTGSRRNLTDFSNKRSPMMRWNSMPTSSSNDSINRRIMKTPNNKSSRFVMSQEVTPPVNYDKMDTPELKKELDKYGIKPQKRNRARQLLTHIYNELHPVVEVSSLEKHNDVRTVDSSDNDEPPAKIKAKSIDRISDDSDSDNEIVRLSQESAASNGESTIPEETDVVDGNGSPDDTNETTSMSSIKKAFSALIKEDKELHNKILTYEPLPLELLSLMLKARGFKCKTNDLMDFLDEECITFQLQSQRVRTRKPRGRKIGPSGRGKTSSHKS